MLYSTHAPLLDVAGAAPTWHGLEDLDISAVLADNEMTDEDGAAQADTGAQALKAAELRL